MSDTERLAMFLLGLAAAVFFCLWLGDGLRRKNWQAEQRSIIRAELQVEGQQPCADTVYVPVVMRDSAR